MLLKHGKIGELFIKNRIVMPPMCMYKSDDTGVLTTFHQAHYTARALGGVGLIIVEATAVEPRGRISSRDLGLWSDEHIENHEALTHACHALGARMAIQLAHAGRKSEVEDSEPIAPSAIAFSESYKMPKALSLKEIKEVKQLFVDAAVRAIQADYDILELHAAHGYLLSEFMSPLSNQRTDKYGGSLENRCRLTLEVAQAIKETVELPLIVRISATEWMKEGWSEEDSIYLSKELERVGVEAIHVSSGGNQSKPDAMPELKALYQANYAKAIKKAVNIPVIAVGLITTAEEGNSLLEKGYCDFVAYGRELLRTPNFPFFAAAKLGKKEMVNDSYLRAF